MPAMGSRRQLRRTDLFLVRVWRDLGNEGASGIAETGISTEGDEGRTRHDAGHAWHGQVRRVSNGESLQFDSLGTLLDVLTAMLEGSGDGSRE